MLGEEFTKKNDSSQKTVFGVEKLKDISDVDFMKKKRHFFIITDTGKPVYSRYGEEADISPIIGTFNIIIHKLRAVGREDDITKVITKNSKTIIRKEGLLFLIFLSKEPKDDLQVMKNTMNAMIHQFVCAVTGQYKNQMIDNPKYNPGSMIDPFNQTMAWTLAACRSTFSLNFNSYMILPMDMAKGRRDLIDTLHQFKSDGIVYKMLITHDHIICYDDDYELSSGDINAVMNLIGSKFQLEGVDYFIPFCIPSISEEGYVNIFFRFLTSNIGLFLICRGAENIPEAKQICQQIQQSLKQGNQLERIEEAYLDVPRCIKRLKGAKYVFAINTKLNQYLLFGMKVYERRNNQETEFLQKSVAIYELYKRLSEPDKKDFEVYERIRNYYISVIRDKDILFFVRMDDWENEDNCRKISRSIITMIKAETTKYFFGN